MHSTVIVGRVGADPKPIGQNGCSFSLATEEYNSSTQQRETTWSRVVAFGKLAETCMKYVTKGRMISVRCRYQVREYVDTATQQKRQDHSFFIQDMELLPDGKRHDQQPAAATDTDGNALWG